MCGDPNLEIELCPGEETRDKHCQAGGSNDRVWGSGLLPFPASLGGESGMGLCLQQGGTWALLSGAVPPLQRSPGCPTSPAWMRDRVTGPGQKKDDAKKTGSSPLQHQLLQGQMEQGVSAGRAVPEPLGMAGVSRAGGSEGHRPQGRPWGTAGARSAGDPQQHGLRPASGFIAQ